MPKIKLNLLSHCELDVKYKMLYVDASTESSMKVENAKEVCRRGMPDEFDEDIFKANMQELDTGSIHCLGRPCTINGYSVFHLSNGKKFIGRSATIFLKYMQFPAVKFLIARQMRLMHAWFKI